MRDSTAKNMDTLLSSIGSIGQQHSKELEFKSKKLIEKLKKDRTELIQDSFDSAFDPDNTK